MKQIEEATKETRTIDQPFYGLNRKVLRSRGFHSHKTGYKWAGNLSKPEHWVRKLKRERAEAAERHALAEANKIN